MRRLLRLYPTLPIFTAIAVGSTLTLYKFLLKNTPKTQPAETQKSNPKAETAPDQFYKSQRHTHTPY